MVKHMNAVAALFEVPAPVPHVAPTTVALLGPAAEARAGRHARTLFDRERHRDDVANVHQAIAA